MALREKLRGTGVALVNVIDFVIKGGVEYLVTLGTTGETPTLSKEEKKDLLNFTFEKTAERVPIVVGVGGNNTRELVDDLDHLPLEKAIAVLSASPNYNKPSQEGLFQHYKVLAEAC